MQSSNHDIAPINYYSENDASERNIKRAKNVKRVISRILFPPLFIWDALKFTVNALVGEMVGKSIVLDTSKSDNANTLQAKIDAINQPNKSSLLTAEKISVPTSDGVILNSLIIRYHDKKNIPAKQYIINFQGRGLCYENYIDEMEEDARRLKCNVLAFNYRGIGTNSKPKSKKDLVKDGIAQVNYLLNNKKVPPDNITLKGYSLGGGVATLVAKHFYQRGITLTLFNDRSFSSITNYMVGQIRSKLDHKRHSGHVEPFFNKLLGWVSKPFLKLALVLTGWEINAAKAYKRLPKEYKDYIVIKSSRAKRAQYGSQLTDDSIITDYASLHAALRPERRKEKAAALDEATAADVKAKSYARKMFAEGIDHIGVNAHKLPEKEIRDRDQGKTGQQYFWKFFNRVHHNTEDAKLTSDEKKEENISNIIKRTPFGRAH